jgi:plasmid stability protein
MTSLPHGLMDSLTIRDLPRETTERLRRRAAAHGCSVEEEAKRILSAALPEDTPSALPGLYARIRARVEPLGGIEVTPPPRDPVREPPRFG